jgi:hypothetical protein
VRAADVPRLAAAGLILAAVTSVHPARADVTWLPGPARALDQSWSSLRDAPVFEATFGPRARTSLGIEPGLVLIPVGRHTLRVALYGLVALENHVERRFFPPNELWRGLVGFTTSYSLDGPGVEVTAAVGHESDHADAYLTRLSPELLRVVYLLPYRGIPLGGEGEFGEYAGGDVAFARRVGGVTLRARILEHAFFHGIVDHQASAEVGLRVALGAVEPFASTSGETIVAGAHNAPVFRALAGVAFPGRFGEVSPIGAFETGYGRGYLVNVSNSSFSIGLRYTPF